MKKDITISKLLGASQLEMAILLGINASQWSMYESDDRDLPNDALSLMNEMLKHVQNEKDKESKKQELIIQQQAKKILMNRKEDHMKYA